MQSLWRVVHWAMANAWQQHKVCVWTRVCEVGKEPVHHGRLMMAGKKFLAYHLFP